MSASYAIRVQVGSVTHDLYPSWAAPYFVVVVDHDKPENRPLLIHCDDIDHARAHLAFGGELFNAELEQEAVPRKRTSEHPR